MNDYSIWMFQCSNNSHCSIIPSSLTLYFKFNLNICDRTVSEWQVYSRAYEWVLNVQVTDDLILLQVLHNN